MTTYAEASADMMLKAAGFFRMLSQQDEKMAAQLTENAKVFEQVANLLSADPNGTAGEETHVAMAAHLMKSAADFFRSIGSQNEPIAEQMDMQAELFESLAAGLVENPNAALE